MASFEDFNSDDELPAVDEGPFDLFRNIGSRTLGLMQANSRTDRLAAKLRTRNLTDNRGAEGTAKKREYAWRLYEMFAAIMHYDLEQPPTGTMLERFILHIVNDLKPAGRGKSLLSLTSLKNIMYSLEARLIYKYPSYSFGPHHRARVTNAIETLRKGGEVMKGRYKKPQWLGFQALRTMQIAWFMSGLRHGVLSWDVHISKSLSILLVSCCDSRSGEIARSDGYHASECLCWSDICVQLINGVEFKDLVVQVELRFEKGSKDDPSSSRYVYWSPFGCDRDTFLDPIVMLLTLALRIGQVEAMNIHEILELIADDPESMLRWTRPHEPVISAINGRKLVYHHPAPMRQIKTSSQQIGNAAGLEQPPWSHDWRRGSARDLKLLGDVPAGVSTTVGAALGHSELAQLQGVTAKYARRESFLLPSMRAKVDTAPLTWRFGAVFHEEPYRPARLPRLSGDRIRTSAERDEAYAQAREAWVEEQKRAMPRSARGTEMPDKRPKLTNRHTRVADRTSRDYATLVGAMQPPSPLPFEPVPDASNRDCSINESTGVSLPNAQGISVDDDHDNDWINAVKLAGTYDPAEVSDEDGEYELDDVASGNASNGLSPDDMLESDPVVMSLIDNVEIEDTALTLDPLQFITFFSRHNAVLHQRPGEFSSEELEKQLGCPSGNSRDPPTQFIRLCAYANVGCVYKHAVSSRMNMHEKTCVYRPDASPEEIARRDERKSFVCEICNKTYVSTITLKRHRESHHLGCEPNAIPVWEPRPCDLGCTSTYVFTTRERYQAHVWKKHAADVGATCALQEKCGRTEPFPTRSSYRDHLLRIHKLSEDDIKRLVPDKRHTIAPAGSYYVPKPCPLGNCGMAVRNVDTRANLVRHLMTAAHKLSREHALIVAGCENDGEQNGVSVDGSHTSAADVPLVHYLDHSAKHTIQSPTAMNNSASVNEAQLPLAEKSTNAKGFPCPLGGCHATHKAFATRCALSRHLRSNDHKLSKFDADVAAGMLSPLVTDPTGSKAPNVQPIVDANGTVLAVTGGDGKSRFPCPLGGCSYTGPGFALRYLLGLHLQKPPHSLSKTKADKMAGTRFRAPPNKLL